MNEDLVNGIIDNVRKNVNYLVNSSGFQDWVQSVKKNPGDLILINNSFVFRDVKTNKNKKCIAIRLVEDENDLSDIVVAEGHTFNSDFKCLGQKNPSFPNVKEIAAEVEAELSDIGQLVFILIGMVDDSLVVDTNLRHEEFERIKWNPKQAELVLFEDADIVVRETFDEDAIWLSVLELYAEDGDEASEDLRDALGDALDRLQDQAKAALHLPSKDVLIENGVTDSIIKMLEDEMHLYAIALEKCGQNFDKDREAYNEILRIAYNFGSDATTYLSLIVSVCDLKPLVLWGTLKEHYFLSGAFKLLPWTRSRKKPSLKNYNGTIGDARNNAFHNLFPFRKTLEIQLPESAVKNVNLLIFSEFTKKKNNQLMYQDKELVDVLVEFTRARQRQIPPSFWRANLNVMEATIDLFKETSLHLKLIFEAGKTIAKE